MDYDIIGDIHGHAEELHSLLGTLGYTRQDGACDGAYTHPSRKTLFVGDLIDRGPHQLEVLTTIRAMVDCGQARMVLGNHEFNAIGWYFRNSAGEPLVPTTTIIANSTKPFWLPWVKTPPCTAPGLNGS